LENGITPLYSSMIPVTIFSRAVTCTFQWAQR